MKKIIPYITLILISLLLSSCIWIPANVTFHNYNEFLEMKSNWNEPDAYSFTYERTIYDTGVYEDNDKGFLKLKVANYGNETEYEIFDKTLDENERVFVPISKDDLLKRFEEKHLFSSITDVYDFFDEYYKTLKKTNKDEDVNVYAEFWQNSEGLVYPKKLYTLSYPTKVFVAANRPCSGLDINITDFTILE